MQTTLMENYINLLDIILASITLINDKKLSCWHFKTIKWDRRKDWATEPVQLLETYNKTSVPLKLS